MKKQVEFWAVLALLALSIACGPSEHHEAPGHEAEPPQAAVKKIPPVAALIVHRVADYDTWKIAFDEHMPARKAAGITGHHLNRGVDDPNMVFLYFPATDATRLEAFLDSPDLAQAMQNAGVEGPPTITLMKTMSDDSIHDQYLPGIVVMHPVKDYPTWRAAYDAFDAHRREVGIVGHAVNQEVGHPNQVIVYHQANDLGTLRTFVDSAELKETMERAGVIGVPSIRFVQVADFAEYE